MLDNYSYTAFRKRKIEREVGETRLDYASKNINSKIKQFWRYYWEQIE